MAAISVSKLQVELTELVRADGATWFCEPQKTIVDTDGQVIRNPEWTEMVDRRRQIEKMRIQLAQARQSSPKGV